MNLRKTKGGKLIERIPIGTEVEILDYGAEWCRIKAGRYTGWMMTKFLGGFPDALCCRKESHAHRGRCADSRTARDIVR